MNRLLQDKGRVLAFGAHPDDLEVGAGGLLARLSEEGADVTMAVRDTEAGAHSAALWHQPAAPGPR